MNNKKKQLLLNYIEIYLINIKEHLIGLDALINEEELKSSINTFDRIHECKKYIDDYFKNKMISYLNEKYELVKENSYYLLNDYRLFGFDYYLCERVLNMNNYRCQVCETINTKMNHNFDIDDCKNIVLSFYKNLLNNEDDYSLVKDIVDNINFVDEEIRSFTNVTSKEVYVRKSDDYSFLFTLVHEIAHAYVLTRKNIKDKDIRLIEMDSMCMEILFLKYLEETKIEVIEDEDGIRPINDYDIEDYFINNYTMFVLYARTVVDEMNITYVIGQNKNDEIDNDVFDKLVEVSPYNSNYFITAKIINDFLDRYLCCNVNMDSYEKGKSVIDVFTNNVSYICSGLFLKYFYDILDRKEEKEKFIMYINNSDEYVFTNFINMFGLTLENYKCLSSRLFYDFKKLMENTCNVAVSEKYKKVIKEELDEYDLLVDRELKSNDLFIKEFKEVINISKLLDTDEFTLDINPFDIKYQLDDCDVDSYEESKKKLILLEMEKNKRNIKYDL